MKKVFTIIMGCSMLLVMLASSSQDFNFNWSFAQGDQKAAVAADFDDSGWNCVDLPHDWAISGPFGRPEEDGGTGKLPWCGEGWYRKRFELAAADQGQRLILIFDGVMASPVVYLNGNEVGSWRYGYNSFWIDATESAKFGGSNVLVVHADTREHASRWYPGAGIYRKVTMLLKSPIHIPVWGVYVTTPEVTEQRATVQATVEVVNRSAQSKKIAVEVVIKDPAGAQAASQSKTVTLAGGTTQSVALEFLIKNPQRWDVESPLLYCVESRLLDGTKPVDEAKTVLGLRTFEWTADDGFHLNGRRLQLYGVNMHHDQGPLGAAFLPRAMERQLQIMLGMGVNALRTSHNAAAPEVLEMCDRMGIIVFNELFDKYGPTAGVPCSTADYVNQHAEKEVRNFVTRDRNHPSVCLWSIGNEIPDILNNHDGKAAEQVANMVKYFKKYDPTRPTTMGNHIPGGARKELHIFDTLDSSGWNYGQKYLIAKENYPDKPLIYSESGSVFGTRGAYKPVLPQNKTDWGSDGYLSAYCLTAASWSDIPEQEFERMIKHSYVAGEFVWTGFDYLGEPTPFSGNNADAQGRRARSSYFGIVDLAGLPKDSFYLYRSHWNKKEHTVHLTPHWNWPGSEGQPIPVMLYTDGDEAELFLNGKSLGRRTKAARGAQSSDNLAAGKKAVASSEEHKQDKGGNVLMENLAGKAADGSFSTRWCAKDDSVPQSWEVDLEATEEVSFIRVYWEKPATTYEFKVMLSADGSAWQPLDAKIVNVDNCSELSFAARKVRKVRIEISKLNSRNVYASIVEVEVLRESGVRHNPYFDVVDVYRLRWLDVPYAPGEIKAVAYQKGEKIGESAVRTVGPATGLRLTPDRSVMQADGMDLCYVTVEMVAENGDVCPLAMDQLTFTVKGAAKLAGVANGDQMGFDSFTDNTHPLFYGKAVAVLRSRPGSSGSTELTVKAANNMQAKCTVKFSSVL